MSGWEIAGFVAGGVSVWLYVRQSIWSWPVGIINSGCWLVLFWSARLYLDAGLQIVYIGLGVFGWYVWLRGNGGGRVLPVSRLSLRDGVVLGALAVTATAGLWRAMAAAGDAAPLPDAATTVVSLLAQYLLTRKKLVSWWCWIAVDLAYIAIYSGQGLYLTAALQPMFIALCWLGLRQWRRSLHSTVDASRATAVATP
jgi:nicotinamide mononucleotide transporter